MVLVFGDIHIGYKFYNDSFDPENYLFLSEIDAFNALEEIYQRSLKDDIEMIVCLGDIFHTPTPTTRNISKFLGWLKKISKLNKPLYIITGNHDVSMYSNSLVYLHQFDLPNIFLFDSKKDIGKTVNYHDWTFVFVPYIIDPGISDKDYLTRINVGNLLSNPISNKQIIATHIQESSCVRGSEGTLLSHASPVISVDEYTSSSIIMTGHIHYGQIYTKKNITVIYPGSTCSMDFSDVNQVKTYALFSPDGTVKVEAFNTTRKFKSIQVSESVDNILDYLSKIRLITNSVYFLLVDPKHKQVDRKSLKDFFESKKCYLGDVRIVYKENEASFEISNKESILQTLGHTEIFTSYINGLDVKDFKLQESDKPTLIAIGLEYLNESM